MSEEKNKGQAAFEFVSYFALFLLVFVIAMAYMSNEELREIRQREDFLVKETAYQIASEIHFAVQGGPGFSRTAVIPKRAGTIEYNASIKDGFVYVDWARGSQNYTALAPLSTSAVSTTTLKTTLEGAILINASKGFLNINNTEGTIYVDQFE